MLDITINSDTLSNPNAAAGELKRSRAATILFVSHTSRTERPYLDPSTRYRSYVPAAALRRRGHRTAVISQSAFERQLSELPKFDYYVFHRPMLTPILADFLVAKKHSRRLIADFDDFIFDVKYTPLMPAFRFNGQSLSLTGRYLARNAAASRYFDKFSLSTVPLALRIQELFKPKTVSVVSNALEPDYMGIARKIRRHLPNESRPYMFGYFSGTATHNADFEMIAPAIAEAMRKHVDCRMLLVGPVAIPDSVYEYRDRIDHHKDVVPFYRLPYLMAHVQTVLAPLERNEFTECKSGLKFFEAALVGCNVIATPIPDIDRFDSTFLRKCHTLEEWQESLTVPFDVAGAGKEDRLQDVVEQVHADIVAKAWEEELMS